MTGQKKKVGKHGSLNNIKIPLYILIINAPVCGNDPGSG